MWGGWGVGAFGIAAAVQFNGGGAPDCDSSDSHGYGGHSLRMMSCKSNLGAWEVRRREYCLATGATQS